MKNTESDFAAAGERYLTEHAAYNLTPLTMVRGVGFIVAGLTVILGLGSMAYAAWGLLTL